MITFGIYYWLVDSLSEKKLKLCRSGELDCVEADSYEEAIAKAQKISPLAIPHHHAFREEYKEYAWNIAQNLLKFLDSIPTETMTVIK